MFSYYVFLIHGDHIGWIRVRDSTFDHARRIMDFNSCWNSMTAEDSQYDEKTLLDSQYNECYDQGGWHDSIEHRLTKKIDYAKQLWQVQFAELAKGNM